MVTTLYAGILGLIYMALSAYVIKGRFKNQINLGDAGNDDMLKRMRVHANFIEYVPLALLLIFLAELEGISEIIIHALCIALVIARLIHPIGIIRVAGSSLERASGALITFLVIIVASILCIKSFFFF